MTGLSRSRGPFLAQDRCFSRDLFNWPTAWRAVLFFRYCITASEIPTTATMSLILSDTVRPSNWTNVAASWPMGEYIPSPRNAPDRAPRDGDSLTHPSFLERQNPIAMSPRPFAEAGNLRRNAFWGSLRSSPRTQGDIIRILVVTSARFASNFKKGPVCLLCEFPQLYFF